MKNIISFKIYLFLILFLISNNSYSQNSAMYYLNYPRSISSMGLGNQGVSSLKSSAAMAINPANLVFNQNINLNFFRDPYAHYLIKMPFIAVSSSFFFPEIGYWGVEYLNRDLGESTVSGPYGSEISTYKSYERAFSVAYATYLSPEFAIGIQSRYASTKIVNFEADNLFICAGINYKPKQLHDKLNLGLSLTNFGLAVTYTENGSSSKEPPPSLLCMGLNIAAVKNNYYSFGFQFELSKPFDRYDSQNSAQSAFKSLFNDWDDFPEDVTVHSGLYYEWLPLSLSNNFNFFQQMYFGNFSTGPKSGLSNLFTHGAIIGFSYNQFNFSLGYAGYWHDVYYSKYLQNYPHKAFQVNLSVEPDLIRKNLAKHSSKPLLKEIIVVAGIGPSLRIGKFHNNDEWLGYNSDTKHKNSLSYLLEADFYTGENSALISKLKYSSIPFIFWSEDRHIESISLFSLYRYHPFKQIQSLFFQAGLGIIQMKPIPKTLYPEYYYQTILSAGIGATFQLPYNLVLMPSIEFISMLYPASGAAPRLTAYNQFDFLLNIGYKLK